MVKLTSVQNNFRANYLIPRGWQAPVSQRQGLLSRIGSWFNFGPSFAATNGITMPSTEIDPLKVTHMARTGGSSSIVFTPGSQTERKPNPERVLQFLEGLKFENKRLSFVWKGNEEVNFNLKDGFDDTIYVEGNDVNPGDNVDFDLMYGTSRYELEVTNMSGQQIGTIVFDKQGVDKILIGLVVGFENQQALQADKAPDAMARLLALFEGLTINPRQISFKWKGGPDLYYSITPVGFRHFVLDGGCLYGNDEEQQISVRMFDWHKAPVFLFRVAGLEGINPLGSFVFTIQKDGMLDIKDVCGFEQKAVKLGCLIQDDIKTSHIKAEEIALSWQPVPGANAYELRISKSKYMSPLMTAKPVIVIGLEHTFTGLLPRTSYWVLITPIYIDPGNPSNMLRAEGATKQFFTEHAAVSPLQNIAGEPDISSVTINFTLPLGFSRCLARLFVSEDEANSSNTRRDSGSIAMQEADAKGSQATFANLRPDTQYFVALHPIHDSGAFGTHQVISFKTKELKLAKVTGLGCIGAPHSRGATISWQEVKNATRYEIEIIPYGRLDAPGKALQEFAQTNSFDFAGLMPETKYRVRVRAHYLIQHQQLNIAVNERPLTGEWSDEFTFTTGRLSMPKNIMVAKVNAGNKYAKVEIKWEAAYGASRYEVQITKKAENFMLAGTGYSTALTSIEIKELEPGQTYYYRVRASVDGGFSSEWSEVFSFKTPLTERQQQQAARTKSTEQSAALKEQREAARKHRQEVRDQDEQVSAALQARKNEQEALLREARNKKARKAEALDVASRTTKGWLAVSRVMYKVQAVLEYYADLHNKNKIKIGTTAIREELQELIRQIIDAAGLKEKDKQKATKEAKTLFDKYVR